MKTYSLLAVLLFWSPLARAEDPCNRSNDALASDLKEVLETKTSPCQEITDAIARLERDIQHAEGLRDAYDAEDRFWLSRLNYYQSGQSAIIDGIFGKSDLASASLMSVEIVMDALVVGKAVSAGTKGYKAYGAGSKYVRGVAKTSMRTKLRKDLLWGGGAFGVSSGIKIVTETTGRESSLSQRMMEAELQRFRQSTANPLFAKADTILHEVENPSFSLVDLIPFVSPARRLNKMFGADDMISDVGDALIEAKKERYRSRRLKREQDQKLGELQRELGRKQAERANCEGANS